MNPATGAMEFDATPEEAVEMMKLHQEVSATQERAQETEEILAAANESGLTTAQYTTWNYLVENENSPNGVTVSAVARQLRITHTAASARLQDLARRGLAERIMRGRYRAVCP